MASMSQMYCTSTVHSYRPYIYCFQFSFTCNYMVISTDRSVNFMYILYIPYVQSVCMSQSITLKCKVNSINMKIVWNQFIMCTIKWRLNTVYLVCAFVEPLYAPIYYLFKYVQCISWILSCFVWANTKLIVTPERIQAYENKRDATIGRSSSEWIKQQRQCQHTDTKCRTQRGKWLWWMKLLFLLNILLFN